MRSTSHAKLRFALNLGLFMLPLLIALAWAFASFPGADTVHEAMKLHRKTHPAFKDVVKFLTNWGNWLFYAVYLGILLQGLRSKRRDLVRLAMTYLVVQLLVAFAVVRVLKIVTGCPRPGVGGLCQPLAMDPGHHSLPSGHTTEITSAAGGLALWISRWRMSILLGLYAAIIAASRVYMGMHHLWDLVFGMILGAYAATAIAVFAQKPKEPQ